ncbi:MAG: response regulator [Cyanobacteria bacterium J06627_28]
MNSNIEVLLVEDSFSDAKMVEAIVSASNLARPTFHHAMRFENALTMLKENSYDLVLLDLHLPDGEGIELIAQIKQQVPKIPVVVFTGLQDGETALAAIQQGAQDYLLKSDTFSPARLSQLGHTDLGNWLVQRIYNAIKQAKSDAEQSSSVTASEAAISEFRARHANDPLRTIANTTLRTVGAGLLRTQAKIYTDQGNYEAAEPLLKSSLAIQIAILGRRHPEVAISIYNLASLYDNQLRFSEAESLFRQSLEIFEQAFGKSHPHTRKVRERVHMIVRLNQAMKASTRA